MNIGSLSLTSPKGEVALIAGPTASGKSALALGLAERAHGTIVNADSVQVYRDLRIISARPAPEEEGRVPHRLYGYRDGGHAWSAADWAADARHAIREAHGEARLPILVGGTGLYIRTLLEGIAPVPPIDASVRAEVRALPVAEAHEALAREDPCAAERLRPTDTSRVARALEVVRSTGRPLAQWQGERSGGVTGSVRLRPLILLPPRQWLYDRCNERFEQMMSDEGLTEVRSLIERGLSPSLPVMRAIGVAEVAAFLRGELAREQALEAGRTATRRYAKRQYTWFAHQPPAEWPRLALALDCGGMANALALLER